MEDGIQKVKITIVSGVIIEHGKILLLKKISKDYYEMPGGKTEKDERVEDCLIRELQEELGITVTSFTKFLELEKFNFENKEITSYAFLIKEFKGKPKLMEKDVFEKLVWVKIKEAQKLPLSPNTKRIIERLKIPLP